MSPPGPRGEVQGGGGSPAILVVDLMNERKGDAREAQPGSDFLFNHNTQMSIFLLNPLRSLSFLISGGSLFQAVELL